MKFGIIGTGLSVPESELTNQDLMSLGIDTTDEWIKTRTGIEKRRVSSKKETTSTLATEAAKQAIQNAGFTPNDIDLIIVATSTPDHQGFPSTACLVQQNLQIPVCPAFDISAACSGFNYALTTGLQFCKSGLAKHALIIGVDCLSRIVDWNDRATCVLFGDGAGAAVLSAVNNDHGILSSTLFADGNESSILTVENKQQDQPHLALQTHIPYIHMDGKTVFKSAIQNVVPSIKVELEKLNLTSRDISLLIPHQANLRIIDQIRSRLDLDDSQVFSNLQRFGNTSAASIPIALHEAVTSQKIKPGDLILLVGFGAGFTWGITIMKWS